MTFVLTFRTAETFNENTLFILELIVLLPLFINLFTQIVSWFDANFQLLMLTMLNYFLITSNLCIHSLSRLCTETTACSLKF